MRFWDASAIVPLCVDEPTAPAQIDLLASEGIAVWWGTPVEATSAVARLRRTGALTDAEAQSARDLLSAWRQVWTEVQPSEAVRDQALRLLGVHELRAADALQLAAALAWAGPARESSELVCLDERLSQAAQREGLRVLPVA